jgi:hypothetical protein
MMDLDKTREQIQTRGYWRFLVKFEESEELPENLKQELKNASVSLRGWDFPQVAKQREDIHKTSNTNDGVKSWTNTGKHKEVWEYNCKGFFIMNRSLREDWFKEGKYIPERLKQFEPGKILYIISALYTVNEFFIFISNLITKGLIRGQLEIRVKLVNTKNRKLMFYDAFRETSLKYEAMDNSIQSKIKSNSNDFQNNYIQLSMDSLFALFKLFNWDNIPKEVLEGDQAKFLKRDY